MGAPESPKQDEDRLTLTITTPGADEIARPVLVWFHGGAWVSGAGSWKWYGGHWLARKGDVVVVLVTDRLRARLPTSARHLRWQSWACRSARHLRWVGDNIAASSDDPNAYH
jgi:para-nitrobenzyl esterase